MELQSSTVVRLILQLRLVVTLFSSVMDLHACIYCSHGCLVVLLGVHMLPGLAAFTW